MEEVLASDNWPQGDGSHDNFGKQRGRTLESAADKDEQKPNTRNATDTPATVATRPVKKIKTSTKLDDDAAYKPSSLRSIVPPVFSSRETRPNEKPQGAYAEEESSESE